MLQFTYQYSSHMEYISELAQAFGTKVNNGELVFPQHLASGYAKAIQLGNGLEVLINECTIHVPVHIKRLKDNSMAYTLRFDEVTNMENLSVTLNGSTMHSSDPIFSGAFLTDSFSAFEFTTSAGTQSRCVNIFFTAEWLYNYAGLQNTDRALEQYLQLKTGILNFEVLQMEYRQLMEEIFELNPSHPMYRAILQNRVMILLEKFFRNLYLKLNQAYKPINEADVKSMMQVEAMLVKDPTQPPPAIHFLAKVAAMSETKLKNLFKKMYGSSPHEYYQYNRMLKARQMLRSGRFTVKETGAQLGYQNLSNFTLAYKKAFKMLPSNV